MTRCRPGSYLNPPSKNKKNKKLLSLADLTHEHHDGEGEHGEEHGKPGGVVKLPVEAAGARGLIQKICKAQTNTRSKECEKWHGHVIT